MQHTHLKRLDRIAVHNAVYFITTCTHRRKPVLTRGGVHECLVREFRSALPRHGWMIGRYVVMPDHVHFFCMEQPGGARRPLSDFLQQWTQWTSKTICKSGDISPPVWQKQFFDHVLRNNESYAEKWSYVRNNPVRAGLTNEARDWPHQGYIHFDTP